MAVALVPSPLLGDALWAPVSAALRGRGIEVVDVPAPSEEELSPEAMARHLIAELPRDRDLLLVPHSNAGLFVPQVSAARSVAGYVFVDALLPPGDGEVPVTSPEMLTWLTGMVGDDGRLPPWTRWWAETDLLGVYPDDETRRRIERQAPRLPLSYFRSLVRVPAGWDRHAGAYLAFGHAYAAERAAAEARGWPTATLAGGHLHQLHEPALVAAHILRLAAEAGVEVL